MSTSHDHDHDHDHGHDHGNGDPHAHHPEHHQPMSYHEKLTTAVLELLVEKKLITYEAVSQEISAIEGRTPEIGARVIAKAWNDPAYKARLLADGNKGTAELGLDMGDTHLVVVENTPQVHNVVVCTLCSCYPRGLLGLPPSWYKSMAYRSRIVREPRAVLKEFGLTLPADVTVRVLDSTANTRYIVIPLRPDGTRGWSEEQLAKLLTREAMIGTGVAKAPERVAG
jgi:nitrile hydratase